MTIENRPGRLMAGANGLLRFGLELSGLAALAYRGWTLEEGWQRYLLAVALPVVAAALWGVFAVPDDPSRSGTAPVPVPGFLRLALESAFFSFAAWSLATTGWPILGLGFGAVVLGHYVFSWRRVVWLLKAKGPPPAKI